MKITEQNFIQQLQLRNQNALMYVVDEYSGLLKSVIAKNMSYMQDYQDDCMNDVLLAIWENIDSFRPEKNSFKNWIAAIAKYKAIDYLRKYKKELNELSYETVEYEEAITPDFLEHDISEKTERLLSCLSTVDRELFMRLYFKDEPMERVSESLNISRPNIYNRLSRAKKKLRKVEETR